MSALTETASDPYQPAFLTAVCNEPVQGCAPFTGLHDRRTGRVDTPSATATGERQVGSLGPNGYQGMSIEYIEYQAEELTAPVRRAAA